MISKLGKLEFRQPVQGIPVAASVLANSPLSWSEDNKISLTTTYGVCIFDFSFSPNGNLEGVPFDRIYISPPEAPNPHILSGSALQTLVKSIKNIDDSQSLMLDSTLTAAHRAGIEISSNRPNPNGIGNTQGVDLNHLGYSKVVWSHRGATEQDECLLCLVTYDHQIRLIHQVGIQWKVLFDITSLWAKFLSEEGKEVVDQYQQTVGNEEYHRFIATTRLQGIAGISWTAPLTTSDESFSILLMATTSSHLALIKVPKVRGRFQVNPSILACFSLDSSLGKISALEWMSFNNNGVGLVCVGTIRGDIEIYLLSLMAYNIKRLITFENSVVGMRVNHLQMMCVSAKNCQYLLFVAKHNILFAYLLLANPSEVKVLSLAHSMLGCYHISGIKVISPNLLYVSTKDGEMKQIEVEFSFKTKTIDFTRKEILFSSKEKGFYNGFCFSPNNTFFAILECVSVPFDHLQLREPTVINLFRGDTFQSAKDYVLTDEEDKTLCKQIDVFESIRLMAYKGEKTFPKLSLNNVRTLSIYLKKVYLWLTYIQLGSLSRAEESTEALIKEKEELRDVLESNIVADYVTQVFSSLTKESFPSDDNFRLSLHLMCSFLEQNGLHHPFVKMIKKQLKSVNFNCTENCFVCSTPIQFTSLKIATCSNGHNIPRCLRTLLPTVPIAMCSYCNLFYHSEASKWYGEIASTCLICSSKLRSRVSRSINR